MKTIYIIVYFCLLQAGAILRAQAAFTIDDRTLAASSTIADTTAITDITTPTLRISNLRIISGAQEIRISFTLTPLKSIHSRSLRILTPYLCSATDSFALPPIEIRGRQKARRLRQKRLLKGLAEEPLETWVTEGTAPVQYVATLGYPKKKTKEVLSLRLQEETESCCNVELTDNRLLAEIRITQPEKPERQKTANVEPAQARQAELLSIIHELQDLQATGTDTGMPPAILFPTGKSRIDLSLAGNERILKKLLSVLTRIVGAENGALQCRIKITGNASPEGSFDLNKSLSHNRSTALKDYLQHELPELPDSMFVLHNTGEDWKGLRHWVENDPGMIYREEVMRIIDRVPMYLGREKQLMDLRGGRPYRYLAEHCFPALRNACTVVIVATDSHEGLNESTYY